MASIHSSSKCPAVTQSLNLIRCQSFVNLHGKFTGNGRELTRGISTRYLAFGSRRGAGLRWGIPNDRRGLTLSGDSTRRPAAGLGGK